MSVGTPRPASTGRPNRTRGSRRRFFRVARRREQAHRHAVAHFDTRSAQREVLPHEINLRLVEL
jgi:uncharacterized membrane protein